MTYEKPEVVVLGNAADLIQGTGKSINLESDLVHPVNPDCEIDD